MNLHTDAITSQQMKNIGELGEQLVARWLEIQGWRILAHRWRCRWGEIDLIAQNESILSFVEVKTRSARNWDAGGMLAITDRKQAKLWRTASFFLTEQPHLADLPCRFDVALVSYRQSPSPVQLVNSNVFERQKIKIGDAVAWQGYQLTLHKYIESAFER